MGRILAIVKECKCNVGSPSRRTQFFFGRRRPGHPGFGRPVNRPTQVSMRRPWRERLRMVALRRRAWGRRAWGSMGGSMEGRRGGVGIVRPRAPGRTPPRTRVPLYSPPPPPHGARCPNAPALPSPPPPRCRRSRVACRWNAPDARAERPMHAHMAQPAKTKPRCPARSLRKIYPLSPHPISTCGNLAWYGTCTRRSVSSS